MATGGDRPQGARMPLRVAAVLAGYLVYRFFERPPVAGVMLGVGFIALAWATIDRFTALERERSRMMETGQTILGVGLLALGAFLAAR